MAAETEAPNFTNINTQEQFIFLMSQENRVLNYKIISTIHEWFTKRLEYSENLIFINVNIGSNYIHKITTTKDCSHPIRQSVAN